MTAFRYLLRCCTSLLLFWCAFIPDADAQVLRLPPRPANALSGSVFAQSIATLPLQDREARIEAEIVQGNVPEFLRRLKPIAIQQTTAGGVTNLVQLLVAPDYLCIGS